MNTSPKAKNLFGDIHFDKVLNCVHCGLCLESCPTYTELFTEQDSPRGRLYLMRGLWEGELELNEHVIAPISRCLGCRACETACPSLVPYGDLLDKTRSVIAAHQNLGFWARCLRRIVFRHLLTSTALLRIASGAARIYRGFGLHRLVTGTPFRNLLPARLVTAHRLMPAFTGRSFKRGHKGVLAPAGRVTNPQRVALFTGCVMDVAEAEIHQASLTLLRAAGCEVVVPQDQTCCGALHVHAGECAAARALAVRNEAAFAAQPAATIIVNAAGCGAQLKGYHELFSEAAGAERWPRLAGRVADILDFLAGIEGFPERANWRDEAVTVLYDAPCHLLHAQKIDLGPRRLLGRIPGVKLIPLTHADRCCGAAGIYNLVHQKLAADILGRKLDDVAAVLEDHPGARYLVTGNSGCLFQLRRGIQERGLPLQVLHPAVLLARRLRPEAG